MIYVDHNFYIGEYRGTIVAEQFTFERLALRASEKLDHFTMGRINPSDITDDVRRAVCAMADILYLAEKRTSGGQNIASESNDGYSVTYVTTGEREMIQAQEEKLYKAAYAYLSRTGLMDFGVEEC